MAKIKDILIKLLIYCELVIIGLIILFNFITWVAGRDRPQSREKVLQNICPHVDISRIKSMDSVQRVKLGGYTIYARITADKDVINLILQGAGRAQIKYYGTPNTSKIDEIHFECEDRNRAEYPFSDSDIKYLNPWKHRWWDLGNVDAILKMELFCSISGNNWTTDFTHWWLVDWERQTVYLIGFGI